MKRSCYLRRLLAVCLRERSLNVRGCTHSLLQTKLRLATQYLKSLRCLLSAKSLNRTQGLCHFGSLFSNCLL